MCRWCLLPILLFTGGLLHAQRGGLELLVLDSVERAPVPGAEVRWDQRERQRIGRTDSEGRILIPEDPGRTSVITIALVGYAPRTVIHTWTTAEGRDQRTVRLPSVELDPVAVTRPAPQLVYQRPDLHAADLLINDEGLWVLAYERPRMLRAEAEQGREILRDVRLVLLDTLFTERASVPVGEDVFGLRRDLRDAVVIEGSANAFGVGRAGDELVLAPFGLDDLRRKVLPWTDTIPGWVLGSNGDQVMPAFDHIAYDPPHDSTELVCTVVDSFMLQLFRSEYKYLKGPEKVVAMNLAQELGVDEEIVAGYMSGFQHNIWFKPLYAPLFVVGDTLLVFDHGSGVLRKFTKGFREQGRVALPYLGRADGRDWSGRVLQDRATGALYAVFARNGQQWLRPIDPVTGTLGDRRRITYRYPERLQVHGGSAYYIHRPVESLQKRSIYRERL